MMFSLICYLSRYHDFKLSFKMKISLLSVSILLHVYSKEMLSNRSSRPVVIFKNFILKVSLNSQKNTYDEIKV